MDYFVGGVAALISGNVTPNRPRLVKKALTPVKHPMSPNVTPKSEVVDDKSIFLSPTLQRKKAIVKKSPKRIFENSDINIDDEEVANKSPKADKVKKHLTEDLESGSCNDDGKKKASKHKRSSVANISPTKLEKPEEDPNGTEAILRKKNSENTSATTESIVKVNKSDNRKLSKKKKKKNKSNHRLGEEFGTMENNIPEELNNSDIKNKTRKQNNNIQKDSLPHASETVKNITEPMPRKKEKKKQVQSNKTIPSLDVGSKNNEICVNPNAISHLDTDSEHESDNELLSENEEEINQKATEAPEQSSDDEESNDKKRKKKNEEKTEHQPDADEINRTIFVGNVPFSKKCKKEIKKIFSKHGAIESVRIRAVPVKDAQTSKKLAVIKNELHPSRATVNVYVKFKEPSSVEKALSENNTVLGDCHLRVNRSDTTGAYDPRRALFVGNLPFAVEDETLRAKFEKCGEIVSVRIIRDKKTNVGKGSPTIRDGLCWMRSRVDIRVPQPRGDNSTLDEIGPVPYKVGFGYVNFASKDGVELALSLSEEDLSIKNRILRVKRCTTGDTQKQKHLKKKEFQKTQPPKTNEKQTTDKSQGAYRRIMHKRKNDNANADGPPNKKHKNIEQPVKNKKQRKEYLGVTAEKKKKKNFAKGQKKKKLISELLTK
ncbi:RNA-binding protein 34 [Eumeta japonica]|uniref:RNA-binding protein 34 n=1 Tax=Eumeta variegata TaxID=151549 RepID=A0A4C1YPV1_EUMVA|nr:RNA-binding protein 34 [Eumeta japonica]